MAGLAARLSEAGLRPFDRLGLVSEDPAAILVGALAAWQRRAIAYPLDPRQPAARLAARLDEVGAVIVLADPALAEALPGGLAIEALGAAEPGEPLAHRPYAGALLIDTSGSSGRPKATLLSHGALAASAAASEANLGWRDGDRWLAPLPLFHIGGLSAALRCLRAATAIALLAAPEAELAAARPTLLSLVPTQLARLRQAGLAPPAALRAVLLGGAPIAPAVFREAVEAGWPLLATYGMTECASQATCQRPDRAEPERWSAGPPLPGVQLAIDEPDDDGVGRIRLAGPTLMTGYWNRPAETAAALVDGWLVTGDRGRLIDGELEPLGRLGTRIISGGENIDPLEVERALTALDGIRDAAVFGAPDPTWGERLVAVLVGRERSLDDLREELAAALPRRHLPREVRWADALPRTRTGKLRRPRLPDIGPN